jgi:hypothetical protein
MGQAEAVAACGDVWERCPDNLIALKYFSYFERELDHAIAELGVLSLEQL